MDAYEVFVETVRAGVTIFWIDVRGPTSWNRVGR